MTERKIDIGGVEVPLTVYEVELLEFFAQRFQAGKEIVNMEEFPRYAEVGKEEALRARKRLTDYGLLKGYSSMDVEIPAIVVGLVEFWHNPPPADYRDRVTRWFWSKWWSIGIYLLVVGLPTVVGWIVMVKTVLEWIGVKAK